MEETKKNIDEKFCFECGQIIKAKAEICPKCGVRSEIVLDLSHTKDRTQIHYCPNDNCKYEFVMQYDEDFENGSLL